MNAGHAVVIEAALNGGRDRAENPAVPFTTAELAAEARRCADEGATLFHVHARAADGGWTADPARYAEVVQALRDAVPDGLVSITSIRPHGVPVETLLDLLAALAADPPAFEQICGTDMPGRDGPPRNARHDPRSGQDQVEIRVIRRVAAGSQIEQPVVRCLVLHVHGSPGQRAIPEAPIVRLGSCIGIQLDPEDRARDVLAKVTTVDRAVEDRGDLAVDDAPLPDQAGQLWQIIH